ncbi:MAG: hypothetical protein ACIAQU_08970 [Phycisphaerales bacterium JB064]
MPESIGKEELEKRINELEQRHASKIQEIEAANKAQLEAAEQRHQEYCQARIKEAEERYKDKLKFAGPVVGSAIVVAFGVTLIGLPKYAETQARSAIDDEIRMTVPDKVGERVDLAVAKAQQTITDGAGDILRDRVGPVIRDTAASKAEETARDSVDEWLSKNGQDVSIQRLAEIKQVAEVALVDIERAQDAAQNGLADTIAYLSAPLQWTTLEFPAGSNWDHARSNDGTYTTFGPVQIAVRAGIVYLRGKANFQPPPGWASMGTGEQTARKDNFLSLSAGTRPDYDIGIPVVIRALNKEGTTMGTSGHELGRLKVGRTGELQVTSASQSAVAWVILDGVSFPLDVRADSRASAGSSEHR